MRISPQTMATLPHIYKGKKKLDAKELDRIEKKSKTTGLEEEELQLIAALEASIAVHEAELKKLKAQLAKLRQKKKK